MTSSSDEFRRPLLLCFASDFGIGTEAFRQGACETLRAASIYRLAVLPDLL
jgi:hypothetical protein